MNIVAPYFERFLVYDSYANRKGKGQFAAIARAQKFAHENKWFLKCDIKKYFDSIPHDKLMDVLSRKFKDKELLLWFRIIISSYSTEGGVGLPIGNLTSQYFANLFLDKIDRLHSPYVRYMDDFVFWSNDKDELKLLLKKIKSILKTELNLTLKENSYINQTQYGMDFLGMRIFPNVVGLSRQSKVRYKRRLVEYKKLYENNKISEYKYKESIQALTAFTQKSNCVQWRRKVINDLGLYA